MKPVVLVPLCLIGIVVASGASRSQNAAPEKTLTNSIDMKLVLIPAGEFVMGSPAGEAERDTDETPHEVKITKPFYMGVFEVTQLEFEAVMGKNPSVFIERNGGGIGHPVEQVKWAEAVDFCQKLSERAEEKKAGRAYRLPTEAEWEYACRAGTKSVFHFGDALSSSQANCNGAFPYGGAVKGPYLRKTARVGSYPANALGLHDMHGNVWEWCGDWYDEKYYERSDREDPRGPPSGVLPTGFRSDYFKVARGGSWLDEARGCRAAHRFRFMPSDPYRIVGFRVVCVTAMTR